MQDPSDKTEWLKLALTPGIGPGIFHTLTERFGTPDEILGKSERDFDGLPGLKHATIRAIRKTADGARDEATQWEMHRLHEKGVRTLTYRDPDFPPSLLQIAKPPVLLFVRGTLLSEDENAVAVVGTRRCDAYGLRMTRRLSGDLATQGVLIVSGLAFGIDGAAHQAALNAGGRTWAFLASGFANLYPGEHRDLAEAIAEQGAVLTEFTLDAKPLRRHFPSRNRLIAGAAQGVLVVQAPGKSGALITARYALEQNRDVFALPGRADDPVSEGPNRLIQDGARLVRNAQDILDELAFRIPMEPTPRSQAEQPVLSARTQPNQTQREKPDRRPRLPNLDNLEPDDRRIVLRLEQGPVHIDRIAADLDLPARKISERMLFLEMKGIILRLPGMSFDLA